MKTFLGNETFQLGMLEMLTTATCMESLVHTRKNAILIHLKQLSTLKITPESINIFPFHSTGPNNSKIISH